MAFRFIDPIVLHNYSIIGCASIGTIYGGYRGGRYGSSFGDVFMGGIGGCFIGYISGIFLPVLVPVGIVSLPIHIICKNFKKT